MLLFEHRQYTVASIEQQTYQRFLTQLVPTLARYRMVGGINCSSGSVWILTSRGQGPARALRVPYLLGPFPILKGDHGIWNGPVMCAHAPHARAVHVASRGARVRLCACAISKHRLTRTRTYTRGWLGVELQTIKGVRSWRIMTRAQPPLDLALVQLDVARMLQTAVPI